jgi:hypothetical protein
MATMDSTPVFDLIRRMAHRPIMTDETRWDRDLHHLRKVQQLH